MNLNRVILAGHLVRDPELKYLPSGVAIAEFRMACNETWKDRKSGEKKEEVCFIDAVFFKDSAESVKKYLTKGSGVLVEGKLKYREWEGKDGSKRSAHSIAGERWQFVGPKPQDREAAPAQAEEDAPF